MSVIIMDRKPELEDTVHYVNLQRLCQSYRALPQEGGVLDQDQITMRIFSIIEEADGERAKLEEKKSKKGK